MLTLFHSSSCNTPATRSQSQRAGYSHGNSMCSRHDMHRCRWFADTFLYKLHSFPSFMHLNRLCWVSGQIAELQHIVWLHPLFSYFCQRFISECEKSSHHNQPVWSLPMPIITIVKEPIISFHSPKVMFLICWFVWPNNLNQQLIQNKGNSNIREAGNTIPIAKIHVGNVRSLQTTETFLHVKFFLSGDSAVPIAWLCPGTGNTLGQEKILISNNNIQLFITCKFWNCFEQWPHPLLST